MINCTWRLYFLDLTSVSQIFMDIWSIEYISSNSIKEANVSRTAQLGQLFSQHLFNSNASLDKVYKKESVLFVDKLFMCPFYKITSIVSEWKQTQQLQTDLGFSKWDSVHNINLINNTNIYIYAWYSVLSSACMWLLSLFNIKQISKM